MRDGNGREGFVLVGEAIPDVIQEIRYYSSYNFVGERVDGYEAPVALLTREAAEALKLVNADMRARGLRLVIYDGYRPQRAVDHFVRWAEDLAADSMKPVFYPEVDKRELFEKGFIARRSGHSRGSTVDLTLLDERTGRLLDMGGPFDFFGELSHPDYAGVTPEQHANRMLLRDAMVRRGFRPLSTEWWHFTLKDEPYPDTFFDFPVKY
ncbi:MAG: peptidase M15 [Clostridiales bacterium]|nr:peptidase M15 [Clostridiales bacterium]